MIVECRYNYNKNGKNGNVGKCDDNSVEVWGKQVTDAHSI